MVQRFSVKADLVADVVIHFGKYFVAFLLFDQVVKEGVLETAEATA